MSDREAAAGMSDDKIDNQPNLSMQELTPAIKMSIEQAHAILGHSSKGAMRQTTAALGMLITRGALKTCKYCAIAKVKQKNMNSESKGEKADMFNGRVNHDFATVKKSEHDKSLSRRMCGTSRPQKLFTPREANSLFT